MSGAILPIHQYAFMAWCSVQKRKHRDNFIFTFILLPQVRDITIHDNPKWPTAP